MLNFQEKLFILIHMASNKRLKNQGRHTETFEDGIKKVRKSNN